MSTHFAVLATLALAILFSPETLVLGLVVASDKKVPRQAAIAFAAGGIAGIAFATGIGILLAHLSGAGSASAAHHDTWGGFILRVVIAAALLTIGVYRAIGAIRHKPIADVSEPDRKTSRLRARLTERFPAAMHRLDPSADLTPRQRIGRAVFAGFAICGLHPKVFPIAIAAGHQILEISDGPHRSLGVVMFAAIAVVPALAPAVIELVRPGASGRIKDGYERIMKVHGRWVVAVLLLAAGAFVAYNAVIHLPAH
ncbi:GAP family protein [Mycobacterium sp. M26]|uniref:GAP family protein n=1 Tax=Mycobacterium sp. M26 TaxID=1762962 RepID=UPI00073EB037|nr:GAP family protein [Mycobacterium sp. M26]